MSRYALLIGVSSFEDARLSKLNAPSADVEALGAVLCDPERGGFTSVAVSIDEDYLVVRDRMAALFDDRDPDDLLLLYYSGHGILGRGNRLFLATSGSNLDRPQARSLSANELRDLMDQTRAEQQVVVLDCCHSGAFAEGAKSVSATAVTEETFAATAAGRYVLTAATAQQFAWDGGSLRQGSPADRQLSHFTSWIVDALGSGQASPDDEQITMDAVFRYVCRRAREEGSSATPQRYVDRGTGDVVIARNPAAAGPAWQELLGRLRSDDWNVRAAAVAELGARARKTGPMAALARETLLDRLGEERDYKVRSVLLRTLGLDQERAPEPEAKPAPDPKPRLRQPRVNMNYFIDIKTQAPPDANVDPPPEKKPAPDAKAEPPTPGPPPLNDRERKVLQDAGITQEHLASLPGPDRDWLRLYVRAARDRFWLWIPVWVLFDLVAWVMLGNGKASWLLLTLLAVQVLVGAAGLLPAGGSGLIRPVPAPASPALAPLMSGSVIVKFGSKVFDHRRLRRLSAAVLTTGILASFLGMFAAIGSHNLAVEVSQSPPAMGNAQSLISNHPPALLSRTPQQLITDQAQKMRLDNQQTVDDWDPVVLDTPQTANNARTSLGNNPPQSLSGNPQQMIDQLHNQLQKMLDQQSSDGWDPGGRNIPSK